MRGTLAICSLVANEEEFLWNNYDEHRRWEGLVSLTYVHAVCKTYRDTNPESSTENGMSTDDTGKILGSIGLDKRVTVIQPGLLKSTDKAQEKVVGRNLYLDVLEGVQPDYFLVVDADEFYPPEQQENLWKLIEENEQSKQPADSILFSQRHIWHTKECNDIGFDRFAYQVKGGYWNVPHCRLYRWQSGLRYTDNHNAPVTSKGDSLHNRSRMIDMRFIDDTYCVHMGFARKVKQRRVWDTNYYIARGEGVNDGRQMYIDCRRAWETWKPGDTLPRGARIEPYTGDVPVTLG